MTDNYWPRPRPAERIERDPARVAFLIPGLAYSAERPLLHFAGAVFARHGWTTQQVWWPERPPQRDGQDLGPWFEQQRSFVLKHLSRLVQVETAPRITLVGKSMGAFAAALAADRNLPAVWLTPLLRAPSQVANDLHRATAPFLLVGSAADPSWDGQVARRQDRPFYESNRADHGMEIDDDPVGSVDILRHVTKAMDDFAARL